MKLDVLILVMLASLTFARSNLVFIEIVSARSSSARRHLLRSYWVSSCFNRSDLTRSYMYKFFISSVGDLHEDPNVQRALRVESETHNDIIFLDSSPDRDPAVSRDETYILDRPTAITSKQLQAMLYALHLKEPLELYIHVDDDAVLMIPRLDPLINQHSHPLLFMGYLMQTPIDPDATDLEIGNHKYECPEGVGNIKCFQIGQACDREAKLVGNSSTCFETRLERSLKISRFFGNSFSPPWALGMGSVMGKSIVDFLVTNADDLKARASADVQTGFWLAPLSGVRYVQAFGFHDYPRRHSMFAAGCSEQSVLVHRVRAENWKEFSRDECVLRCPSEPSEYES